MDAAIAEMALGPRPSDGPERGDHYIDGDLRFHLAIAEATRNGVILHTMGALRDVIRRALMSIFRIPGAPSARTSSTARSATRSPPRDAGAARAEMRAHLVRVESDVHDALAVGPPAAGRRRRWLSSATSGSV